MTQGLTVDLRDRRAVVTGASRGIGRACALALARCGATTYAIARDSAALQRLRDEAANAGFAGEVLCLTGDVCSREGSLMDDIAALPRLDILVNNVGGNRPRPMMDTDDATLDWMIDINLVQAFRVARAATRAMVGARRGGSIINMSSQMGHIGSSGRTAYCAVKHAIEGLTKAMAIEFAPHRIRVNAVAPTFIDTDLVRPMLEDAAFRTHVMDMLPLQRIGSPDDVAAAVLYLASDASSLVTGTSLKVDGGWTAR
jgi:NAD(P)-dependent dehydrogenase (short-subunit alcohol dehydrogenase family)